MAMPTRPPLFNQLEEESEKDALLFVLSFFVGASSLCALLSFQFCTPESSYEFSLSIPLQKRRFRERGGVEREGERTMPEKGVESVISPARSPARSFLLSPLSSTLLLAISVGRW